MKQQLAIHGRDHRPGGADPVPFELPWCMSSNGAVVQTVTATAELTYSSSLTNDRRTFRFDPTDPEGVLIFRRGMYQVYADVHVESSDTAVVRAIYPTAQLLSNGPLFGIGDEYGQNGFALGGGQNQSSVGAVTSPNTISKSNLNHIAIGRVTSIDVTDPVRFAVILEHSGTDYDTGTLESTMTIVRLGDIGDDTPPPTDMTP